jgi:hypothetical protein
MAKVVTVEGFQGLRTDIARSKMSLGTPSHEKNGDRSLRGAWRPRPGLADTGLTDGTSKILALGWAVTSFGNYMVECRADGSIHANQPDPTWEEAPAGQGYIAAPSLSVTDKTGSKAEIAVTHNNPYAIRTNIWRDGVLVLSLQGTAAGATVTDTVPAAGAYMWEAASVIVNGREGEKASSYAAIT